MSRRAANKLENLYQLFPSIDKSTINQIFNEANGDIGKSIVLLIQTSPSPSPMMNDSDDSEPILVDPFQHEEEESDEKKQHMLNHGGKYWQMLSIIFWILIAVLVGMVF
eukprot:284771_1